MADTIPSARTLFRSPVVAITDWHCGAVDSPAGGEASERYVVCVTRRGAYVRQTGGGRGAHREQVFADAGTAVFYEPGLRYRVTHPVPGGDCCTVFEVPTQRFPSSHSLLDARAMLLHAAALGAARAGVDPVAIEETATAFVAAAVAMGRRAPPPARRTAGEYAQRVRAVVARRLRERLTLGEIAAAVECSPYHLSRLFRAATGSSIHRYLVRARLRYALDRMLESRDHLSRIGLDAGFASHSHFTDAFRREFGVQPSVVRAGATTSSIAARIG